MTPVASTSPRASLWLPGFIALGIVWGLSFLFISVALTSLTPFGVAAVRTLLGAGALLAWSGIRRMPLSGSAKLWGLSFVFALFVNVIPAYLFALAETYVSSALAGVLNATTPMMTVIMTFLFFRDQRVSGNMILGIGIGFFGIVVLSGTLFEAQPGNAVFGIGTLLVATACYGFAFPFARRYITPSGLPASTLATMQLSSGAMWFLLGAPFFTMQSAAWTLDSILAITALGILGTGFAYIWNFRTIQLAGPAIASTVTYITPVVAVIAGVVFIHESIHWYQVVGGGIVILSAALVQERIRLMRPRKDSV